MRIFRAPHTTRALLLVRFELFADIAKNWKKTCEITCRNSIEFICCLCVVYVSFAFEGDEMTRGDLLMSSISDDLRNEIAEAVEASGVCCPEQVCDACIAVAADGGCWRAELASAIANDAAERKALGID